ncbi:MAG: hypothetical protein ABI175_01225 [Polyangiales bacterium]
MRPSIFTVALACSALAFAGCALQQEDPVSEGSVDDTEDAVTLAALYGTWEGDGGAFYSLTFTKDAASTLGGLKGRRFEATIDTGIRCFTTPCSSSAEVVGVYKTTSGVKLTLSAYDKPSREFARVLGDYKMKLVADTLTLTRSSDPTVVESFHRVKLHTAKEMTKAAEAYAWPTRYPEYVYRTFDTRAAAETWGSKTADSQWLAHDGETTTVSQFVAGSNDLWSQEFTVDKRTLAVTVTGEH